jgi:hypothetical protein
MEIERIIRWPQLLAMALVLYAAATLPGCGEEGGGVYACRYESRHSACGGGDYTDWAAECYSFNIDDYLDGWTPEQVCDKFTGSDNECGGSCCITVEYRNNVLSGGTCG